MSFVFTKTDNFQDLDPDIASHLPRIISNRKEEFQNAVNQNIFSDYDFEKISLFCHKVEGIASSYGLNQLDEIIRHIHKMAKESNTYEIDLAIPILCSYFETLE